MPPFCSTIRISLLSVGPEPWQSRDVGSGTIFFSSGVIWLYLSRSWKNIPRKMPERCVAARCNNVGDPKKGISMHKFPFFGEECPIKKKRRKQWINFVLERRKMWVPGKSSSLCSDHFTADDFDRPLNMELNLKRDLKKDDIGVCVYPTKHAKREGEDDEPPSKKSRDKRMVRNYSHTCS